MFSRSERGLKRKANGKLRGSRQQLLRELRPSWWADVCMRKSDARMRKSLGNLLALDSASSDWVDEVRRSVSGECGRHYLCTKCGNTGAHALTKDVWYGLHYQCLECGGKGMVVHGGVSAMSDVGSDRGRDDCGHVDSRFGCDGGATVLPVGVWLCR